MSYSRIDTPGIRRLNREEIFEFIKKNPGVTKAGLVKELSLSLPTVTGIADELEQAGLVAKKKSEVNTGGRTSMGYCCAAGARLAVGIQLTDRYIKGVLVDLMGDIVGDAVVREIRFSTDESYRREIGNVYSELVHTAGADESRVMGAGITIQGITDSDGTKVLQSITTPMTGMRRDELARYIPVPSRLFHDLAAAGYDRKLRISGNVFYLSLNSSIGGAILINGEVYPGNGGKAGEIGHMVIEKGGRTCYCGKHGCFDAYCSTLLLKDFAGGGLADFFTGLDQNMSGYKEFWQKYTDYLAEALCSIRMIFDGMILIGGEMGRYAGYYLDTVTEKVDKMNLFGDDRARDYIRTYPDGENAIAVGAAMYYIDNVLEDFGSQK